MLRRDAGRVLHGHLVARKRHHLGAERDVGIVKWRALERRAGIGRGHCSYSCGTKGTPTDNNSEGRNMPDWQVAAKGQSSFVTLSVLTTLALMPLPARAQFATLGGKTAG